MQINWDNFKTYNQDSGGVRYKFEDLCRQLFVNENISGNKQFKYLHANPNNPGLETEPIYDEANKRYVGFQSKFFENTVKYKDIEDSAEKTVEHYRNKVDLVYLFCNKPLTTSSLTATVNILKAANIELQPITNDAILDLVRFKYPQLGHYYFGSHTIDKDWFRSHSSHMFDDLGERYNSAFNVETQFSIELSLFVHDQRAVDYINGKKTILLEEIEKHYWKREKNRPYLNALSDLVETLPDVSVETLYESIQWKGALEKATAAFLEEYRNNIEKLEEMRIESQKIAFEGASKKEEQKKALLKYQELGGKIKDLDELIKLPTIIEITEREQQLLKGNVLTVLGRAGSGKSQLFAYETKSLIDEGREVLLLLSGVYFTPDPIHDQIMNNLNLDYSLEELLNILETIGEINNCIVPVFIDALNEIWNKKLWKTGLPEIIEAVKARPMIRLAVSYRPEYEKLILSDSILEMKQNNEVLELIHNGFEDNSIQAVKEFMNHYGIPFTPFEYFGYEMTNPLFLTLYCKTYNGEDVSLPELYERLVKGANAGIFKVNERELTERGYTEEDNIIDYLIEEIASVMAIKNVRSITQQELFELKFWSYYQLAPAAFVKQLVNEHILHETVLKKTEIHYYFAYDQMNDYYCAKAIVQLFEDKKELRNFLSNTVLNIQNGKLNNTWNADLFVNACALYAERYGEECIDIIDVITDSYDSWMIFSRYIRSFQWRDKKYIPADKMCDLLRKYPCEPEDLWKMLIGNSIKISHPLNADFLNEFLSSYSLNKRDYLWTIYINRLTWDETDRIVQLVQMYDHGEMLEMTNDKQTELLLTLFGWILTSSNRWLRDLTSKAMIEILKMNFSLCKPLLEKFKDVNDPYVVQRLYGVAFGACCKQENKDEDTFCELAEFVYNTIFNQDKVYPDILLRDYGRMIVERFLYDNPNYGDVIDCSKIRPPYNSDPIPKIDDQKYLEKDYSGSMLWLIHSMRFEDMGMYGDFGRYVFQSALHDFEVDDYEIFNYALYYIVNGLGFREEYFDEHDKQCGSYYRHDTIKTERIGKKYQWITMFNILARVSDNCKMINRWSCLEQRSVKYDGPWEPYVRDFDPTLNQHFMVCQDAPIFNAMHTFIAAAKEENNGIDLSNQDMSTAWLKEKGVFFRNLKNILMMRDSRNTEWISLSRYIDTGRNNLLDDKLLVWSWIYAYFAKPEQEQALRNSLERGNRLIDGTLNSHHQTYTVYNREYPWSPSCILLNEEAMVDIFLPTGEKETVTETVRLPDFSEYEVFIKKLGYSSRSETSDEKCTLKGIAGSDKLENENFVIPIKEVSVEREIEESIGKIMHATTDLHWGEEYDASKEEAISWSVPCADIIETLSLEQKEYDGFYYDSDGELAAFDTELVQKIGGVVIRKDLLDEYLFKTGLELIWIVQGEKEIHASDLSISRRSKWEALYKYVDGELSGDVRFMKEQG